MRQILLLFLLLFHHSGWIRGQLFQPNQEGLELFNYGSELLKEGKYKSADSILSLALCTYKNENVYYNRAVTKLYQYDTLGFCLDMGIAANKYFDNGAAQLFARYCCVKVDTVYYDNKYLKSGKYTFRYFEVVQQLKFGHEIVGMVHDKKSSRTKMNVDYGCDDNLIGMEMETTDIIAAYFLKDTVRYYFLTSKPASVFNVDKYEEMKKVGRIVLNAKYNNLKTDNNLDKINIFYNITISKTGEILGTEYLGTIPVIPMGDVKTELEKDLSLVVSKYPKLNAASFHGEKVNSVVIDSIDY